MKAEEARRIVAELGLTELNAAAAAEAPPLPEETRRLWRAALRQSAAKRAARDPGAAA